jgi:hypothetical protein
MLFLVSGSHLLTPAFSAFSYWTIGGQIADCIVSVTLLGNRKRKVSKLTLRQCVEEIENAKATGKRRFQDRVLRQV